MFPDRSLRGKNKRPRARYDERDAELDADLGVMEMLAQANEVEIDRELAARSLRAFVEVAWSQVEPAREFVPGWHIDAICEHLEAVTRHEITRLVINVPPGSSKSLLACVFWPTWSWTFAPRTKWIFGSYSGSLSRRDALRMRRMIESKWFSERWGHVARPNTRDEWSASKFSNTEGGFRLSTSVGGGVTGDHGDVQVVDDPTKPLDVTGKLAVSRVALDRARTWWDETMSSRLVDFESSARVIIMQRLHENDLAGHALRARDEGDGMLREAKYEHLCLPMEYEPKRRCHTVLGYADKRTEEGALLWPERVSAIAVAKLKDDLGPRGVAAQLQQTPSPAGGAVFKRGSWKWYGGDSGIVAPSWNKGALVQSWDCSFKSTEDSSFVAGVVLSRIGPDFYLVDCHHERLAFSGTLTAIRKTHTKWPRAIPILIEDKANGTAVMDVLRSEITGIKAIEPEGGKESRANAVEVLFETGNVHFPHPTIAPWIEAFIEELMAFPAGSHDDRVDALTQGLTYLHTKSTERYRAAMEKMR